jgi:hypothetical protein
MDLRSNVIRFPPATKSVATGIYQNLRAVIALEAIITQCSRQCRLNLYRTVSA